MSVYYEALNLDKNESIDASRFGSPREGAVPVTAFANVLTFAMLHRWCGDRVHIVSDWQPPQASTDVTEAVVHEYNAYYLERFKDWCDDELLILDALSNEWRKKGDEE